MSRKLTLILVLPILLLSACAKREPDTTKNNVFEVGGKRNEKNSTLVSNPPPKPPPLMNGSLEYTPSHVGLKLPKNRGIHSFPSKNTPGMVALTIDVETNGKISELLDALKEQNVKMTFFICGSWGSRNRELLKRIADEGHEFGNHTLTHAWLTRKSESEIRAELENLEKIVFDATGKTTKPYFRPPYGANNAKVNKIASDLGWRNVLWNATAGDAQFPRPSKERVTRNIMALRAGSIYLCHSFVDSSVDALIASLPKLKEKGLQPVTLSELMQTHLNSLAAEQTAKANVATNTQKTVLSPPKAQR
ncbi:MAG: polysaccharide deacetylase family protein [Fimbriimonadales bacterium]